MPLNEADTCRIYVTPKLRESGWDASPHSLTEQRTFTDGRVIATGGVLRRGPKKRADYVLRYRHNSRTDSWSLDMESIGDAGALVPVLTGKKLFVGHDLLRMCFEDTRPPGRLFLLNIDKTRDPPTSTNLERFRFVYLDPGETLGGY